MSKFIALTIDDFGEGMLSSRDREIHINIDHISFVKKEPNGETFILLMGEAGDFHVEESVEEVLSRMRAA